MPPRPPGDFRDVPSDRGAQVHPAVGNQAHHRGRGEGLADRAEHEHRARVDRERVVDAGDAVAGVRFLTVGPGPDGYAGDSQLLGKLRDELGELGHFHFPFLETRLSAPPREALYFVQEPSYRSNLVQEPSTMCNSGPRPTYPRGMARDTLKREQIVQAAVDLLDAEGLEGLNMRALGQRLGSAATAVYWHVDSKYELVSLAADQAWHEVDLPDLSAVGWRAAATQMATGVHAMLARHPWLVQAFGSYVLYGPGKARHDDRNLAIYEAAGFRGAQVEQAAATVFTFVIGNALGPAAAASLTRKLDHDGGHADELVRDTMAKAREVAAQFPYLRARLGRSSATEYASAPAKTFEFGLRAVLDGLEAQFGPRHHDRQERPPGVVPRPKRPRRGGP